MKIAMIGHKDFPSRSGGVEVVVYELSTRLAKLGEEVTVYNRTTKWFTKNSNVEGVKTRPAPTFKKESLNAMVSSFTGAIKATFKNMTSYIFMQSDHQLCSSSHIFLARKPLLRFTVLIGRGINGDFWLPPI